MLNLIFTSILMGAGLAMDAGAVSMANGLNYPNLKIYKIFLISIVFASFQSIMPLIGFFVGSIAFQNIEWLIPWIALILLVCIGGKMLLGQRDKESKQEHISQLTLFTIIFQSLATSIDALSVGFTIADYEVHEALICASIIAITTFLICLVGFFIGKRFGTKLEGCAEKLGGIILIIIGIVIFIKGII